MTDPDFFPFPEAGSGNRSHSIPTRFVCDEDFAAFEAAEKAGELAQRVSGANVSTETAPSAPRDSSPRASSDEMTFNNGELPTHIEGFGQPMARFQRHIKSKIVDPNSPTLLPYRKFGDKRNDSSRSSGPENRSSGNGGPRRLYETRRGDGETPNGDGYGNRGRSDRSDRSDRSNSYGNRNFNSGNSGYKSSRPSSPYRSRNNYSNQNRDFSPQGDKTDDGEGYSARNGESRSYENNANRNSFYKNNNRYPNAPRAQRPPKPYEVNPNDIDPNLLMDEPMNLDDEPLSIAEELAEEINHGKPNEDEFDKIYKQLREKNYNNLADLQRLSMNELIEEARKENLAEVDIEGAQRQDLIFRILKERVKLNGLMYGEGTLEILPDGFGFLRSSEYHYISCPDDIYVSPSQIRRFGLKNGVTISGQIRPPKENERYFALLRVEAINYREPNELIRRKAFDDLTPIHPERKIRMETAQTELDTRVTDLVTPLGFGQRGLIVSPPRAGKTILMQKMAKAALRNYPDLYVFMLLIDERPEEVTDMERQIKGPNCEVISSTFDETSSRHIQVAEMVLEKAKRMVEYGRDVLIFLDSITRLARAWNAECPQGGKIMTGGVDANALQSPKKFFGAARRVEEGGSLTIVATALVDTGSKMDTVIFEEFKGTGNLEIVLDRTLVDRRIWPAIDINASGTRREEMLLSAQEYDKICALRRQLSEMSPCDAMETLTRQLAKYKTNADFLDNLRV